MDSNFLNYIFGKGSYTLFNILILKFEQKIILAILKLKILFNLVIINFQNRVALLNFKGPRNQNTNRSQLRLI